MTNAPQKQGSDKGLASALSMLSSSAPRTCNVAKLLVAMDGETAGTFAGVLDNPEISNNRIRAALLTDGIRMSRDTISDHRKRRCCCYAGGKS